VACVHHRGGLTLTVSTGVGRLLRLLRYRQTRRAAQTVAPMLASVEGDAGKTSSLGLASCRGGAVVSSSLAMASLAEVSQTASEGDRRAAGRTTGGSPEPVRSVDGAKGQG